MPTPRKSTHRVEVVRVGAIEQHPNADTLGIVHVYGYTGNGYLERA